MFSCEFCEISKNTSDGCFWNFAALFSTISVWACTEKNVRQKNYKNEAKEIDTEAATRGVLSEKPCNFIKKEALAQVFSCQFCKISKNFFSTENLLATASLDCLCCREVGVMLVPSGKISERKWSLAIQLVRATARLLVTRVISLNYQADEIFSLFLVAAE